MKLEIRFPGTGSGKTSLTRFHSSLLLSDSDYNLLVDTGDGISRALLQQNIPYNSIGGILISHLHPDHFSGLAGLIVQMKMAERKSKLLIYTHHSLLKTIQNFLKFSYIFIERTEFPLDFFCYDFDENILVSSGLFFIARGNTHLKKYKHDPFLSRASSSFLFTYGNKNIYYSGDIGSINDLLLFNDHNIDILITEATHLNIEELAGIYQQLKPEKIILTHLSDDNIDEIKLKSAAIKNFRLFIAEDGMTLSV